MFIAKLYHKKWSLIRRLILKRAAYACEGTPKHPNCRAAELSAHPQTGKMVVLSVCHLDNDRNNNRFYNLRAVCQRCHLDHDRYHKTWGRRYGSEVHRVQMGIWPLTHFQIMVAACGILSNPRFYKGRGVNRTDLNERKLHKLYMAIIDRYNEAAGAAFIELVATMPELSAYEFLIALFELESQDWSTEGREWVEACETFSSQQTENIRQAFFTMLGHNQNSPMAERALKRMAARIG